VYVHCLNIIEYLCVRPQASFITCRSPPHVQL